MEFLVNSLLQALSLVFRYDPEVYFAVWTSVKVSAASTLLASIAGVPLGLLIALTRFRGKSALQLLLNTLMALPTVVIGLFFYAMLSRRGPFGAMALLFTPSAIIIGLFVLALPTIVNLTIAAVQSLDKRLLPTCKLLGATPAQQGLKILHEGRFGILAAVVIAFGRVISEVGIAMMLGGNIRGFTRTMTTAIALETGKGEFELGLALGIFLLAVAFLVNSMLFVLQRSKG